MAKAKKEPVDNSKALAAITIAGELQNIVNSIIEAGGECDDATMAQLATWTERLEVKAENIGLVKMRLESDAAYFKQVEEAARAQRKSRESAVGRLTKYLARCMEIADVKSIRRNDGLFSISLCDGRAGVEILDEKKLPYEFTEIVELVKPKTAAIKEALQLGESVPGASLVFGEKYLQIRSKAAKAEGENKDE